MRISLSRWVAGSAASHMVSPFTRMTPVSGRSRKFRHRSNVVLPEPDEPMIASASPCSRCRDVLQDMGLTKTFPDAGGFE